jgi:hypothetical protein
MAIPGNYSVFCCHRNQLRDADRACVHSSWQVLAVANIMGTKKSSCGKNLLTAGDSNRAEKIPDEG